MGLQMETWLCKAMYLSFNPRICSANSSFSLLLSEKIGKERKRGIRLKTKLIKDKKTTQGGKKGDETHHACRIQREIEPEFGSTEIPSPDGVCGPST